MVDQNPFSNYSADEQSYIADQLRTAVNSGKLNPAQVQGAHSALQYLPGAKGEPNKYTDIALMSQSTWQRPKQPSFQDTMYVDPQAKEFGGDIGGKYLAPHGQLVDVRNVREARAQIQTQMDSRARTLARGGGGDEAGDNLLMEGMQHMPEATGALGAQLGGMPFKQGSDTQAIGRATGRFLGGMAGDPMTYGFAALGGVEGLGAKAIGLGFTTIAAKGAVESSSELGEVWDRTDIPRDRKIELGTNIALNALMGGLAGSHTVKSFLDKAPAHIPVEDRAEIQQRIESEWQQQPNGQMIRKQATPAVTDNRVVNRNYQGGDLSRQFPEGSFQSRMIDKRGAIPVAAEPEAKFAKTVEEAPASQTGVLSADGVKPASVSGASPERAGDTKAAAADTDYFAKAKAEWMEKNPGVSPDKGLSWIARRSNEMKTGVADKSLEPEQTAEPSADKTPVKNPSELTPRDKAKLLKPDRSGVTDLRTADPDTRHEWINMKAWMEVKGVDAADAFRQARANFGPERHIIINSFLDKDGTLRHGVETPVDEKGQPIMHPSPLDAEAASPRLSLKGQQLFDAVQKGEGKFNELTNGKHPKVLDSLWETTKRTLPDAPHEAKLSLYNKGLGALLDAARDAKSVNDFQKAFDIVTKKGEGGFVNPFGKQRISEADAKLMAKLHADTTLARWEKLPDAALQGRKVEKKLSDPALRNSVYGAGDPAIEGRYEALLARSSKLRASDPVASLGQALSGHNISERDVATGALRQGMGTANRSRGMAETELKAYRDEWKSRPISDTIRFLDAIENGDLQSITDPRDRTMAGRLRELLDNSRDKIRALGREIMRTRISEYDNQIARARSPEQAAMWQREKDYIQKHLDAGETSLLNKFYEDYFPHLWRYGLKDLATNLMQGRRPFAPRGFLRQRTYATFTEGIADGMEPVTYNPVDMVLLKLHEMDRFAASHTAFNIMKDRGLTHIFTPDQVPDGWTKVNDNMFNAGSEAAWYMPKDAATPFNRHLSPGLRGNVLYDVISHYSNLINQFNLGFSAFHGVETGVNLVATRLGLGITKLSRGDIRGLKDVALSPAAWFQGPAIGRKVAATYLEPGRYAQYDATANAIETANGRVRMPEEYTNQATKAFQNAWKEAAFAQSKGMSGRALSKAALGTFRSVGALMEQANKPLMEMYVPSAKLGAFHWMAEDILERLPADAPKELIQKELNYAWDRVDDRFGQVVYDNLFWNRTAKDIAHVMIRSVGWNYGDARELGGAVWDLRDKNYLKSTFTGKGISPKQGYVLGLLGITATMGAVMNQIYGQKIDNPIDLLYPKNGKMNPDGSAQRIYVKTYIHDAYQFSHAPGQTGLNKLAPVWHQLGEMYQNADYYGTQIHPIHATTGDALTDPETYTGTAKYLADQALPFSLRNFNERKAQGEGTLSALSSGAAILPAPKWVGQSKAELLAFELFKTKLKQGPNDAVKDESVRRYHELASGYAANRFTAKDISDAFKNGQITAKQLDGILDEEEGKLSPLERHAKQLEPHELLRVWEVATPLEKKILTDKFLHAWDSLDTKYTDKDRASLNLDKRFLNNWQTFIKSKQSN